MPIRLTGSHKTAGGSEIPPGDYTLVPLGSDVFGVQVAKDKPIYTLSAVTKDQILQLLQQEDERVYLNDRYALSLTNAYNKAYRLLSETDKPQHRYFMGKLMSVPFMNKTGWPEKNKDGAPAMTKAEAIEEAKKIEKFLFSTGYTKESILQEYEDDKPK